MSFLLISPTDVCALLAASGPATARRRRLFPRARALLPEPSRAGEGGGAAEALQGHRAPGKTDMKSMLCFDQWGDIRPKN